MLIVGGVYLYVFASSDTFPLVRALAIIHVMCVYLLRETFL